jgi:hypothetical protein
MFFSAAGISPERSARAATPSSAQRGKAARSARSRRNSASSSQASANYREGTGANSMEQFDNSSATRTPAKIKSGLDTEQRSLLEQTLRNQGLDPDNLSPINQDILRGGQSGIQQHDVGASTRTVREKQGSHTHKCNNKQEEEEDQKQMNMLVQ